MRVERENNTYHFYEGDKKVATGYIIDFMASKLYEKDRVNYFIDFDFNGEKRQDLVAYIIEEVKKMRQERYPHMDARVYHCCFSDRKETISFFKTIDGFKADESMVILKNEIDGFKVLEDKAYPLIYDNLKHDKTSFLESHSQIFVSAPYTEEKLDSLLDKGMKSIGFYDGQTCIANILLLEDEEQAWVEDLFVKASYRNQGLASHLLCLADQYFYNKGYKEVYLEVWHANEGAVKLYEKHGYKYEKTTEVSIGMMI